MPYEICVNDIMNSYRQKRKMNEPSGSIDFLTINCKLNLDERNKSLDSLNNFDNGRDRARRKKITNSLVDEYLYIRTVIACFSISMTLCN